MNYLKKNQFNQFIENNLKSYAIEKKLIEVINSLKVHTLLKYTL